MISEDMGTVNGPLTSGVSSDAIDEIIAKNFGSDLANARRARESVTEVLDLLGASQSFQSRVQPWMMACFGPAISDDLIERNHRFLEEALELVQACGCTAPEAHKLVDYVFGRPVGEQLQEVGGVMVTLAALCLANRLDMHAGGEIELSRIWTVIEKIRSKQAMKAKIFA